MEKWIAVIGSPRKGENTESLVDVISDVLKTFGIDVFKYNLNFSNINTCNACEYCISHGHCNINDDVSEIIDRMKSADGVIFASPSYNYNMTAQMKALLDRTFSLNDYMDGWSSRVPDGKKAIIASTCMGKTEEYMGFTVKGMSLCLSDLGFEVIEEIPYYNTKEKRVKDDMLLREQLFSRLSPLFEK